MANEIPIYDRESQYPDRVIIGYGKINEDGIFEGHITDPEWKKKLMSDHHKHLSIEGE